MANLQTILSSLNALDPADKRVLRDVLDTQLAAVPVRDNDTSKPHPLIGLLSDDPALADEIEAAAMLARETRPLRVSGE